MPIFTRATSCTDSDLVSQHAFERASEQVRARSRVRRTGFTLLSSIAIFLAALAPASAEWKVDFSRRSKVTRDTDLSAASHGPASVRAEGSGRGGAPVAGGGPVGIDSPAEELNGAAGKGVIEALFDVGEPVTDIVVLNTDKGFVPSTVRVRKNGKYKITIVNVNDKEKNVSFILDGFSEHHATYFGKVKSFFLEPKKEGVFSFQSPETAAEGKLVVFSPQITVRNPASSEPGK